MKKRLPEIISAALICVFLAGCSGMSQTASKPGVTMPGSTASSSAEQKESYRLGIIKKIDTDGKNITFWDQESQNTLMYPYNSGTSAFAKGGTAITIGQLRTGMVVDIYADPTSDMITRIQVSTNSKVWVNSKVTSFSVDDVTRSMKIGQSLYQYTDNTLVYSDDKEISIMELNRQDQLTVYGYDTQILSVIVDKGHGYISLKGDKYFIGGYINVGGKVVRVIDEDMLILVQEGTYKVEVSNGEYIADKQVTVKRNENTIVDFSVVPPIVEKTGSVKFNIDPEDAVLYEDGKREDASQILTLSTGDHAIRVTASGYDDYTGTLRVGQNYSVIDIYMTSGSGQQGATASSHEQTEAESSETEAATETTGAGIVSENDKVTVSGPEGGFIYFDGKYMGTAPVTFSLVTGTHVISVLYDSRIKSYTVNLAEGGDPVVYDFTDK